MRSTHQPISLSKFKKQVKENIPPLQLKQPKESLQYDLMLLEQSLQFQKDHPKPNFNAQKSKQPLGDATNYFSQTMSNRMTFVALNQAKDDDKQLLGSTGPVMTRNQLSKNFKQLKNIHRTIASYKPTLSAKRQNKIQNSRNTPVNNETPSLQNSTQPQKIQLLYEERISLMQKAYDEKIGEVMSENQRLIGEIDILKQCNQNQEKEKMGIIVRMDMVEQQMKALLEDHSKIQELQDEFNKLEPEMEDRCVQTQNEKIDGQAQTLNCQQTRQSIQINQEVDRNNEGCYVKSKSLKNELEWYKIHCNNLTTESKIALENKQIQWRQKCDLLQKQYDQLNQKYSSKCSQVRQKEQLLNKLIKSK